MSSEENMQEIYITLFNFVDWVLQIGHIRIFVAVGCTSLLA
jgi:hypothetical protein